MSLRQTMRVFGVLAIAIGACSPSRIGAAMLLTPLRVPLYATPSAPHENIEIKSADGLRLEGWLFRPEGKARGLVVLIHGKDINRSHFIEAAEAFTARGYAVLAYDQRAHGRSEGQYVTYGAKEVDDLRRFLDALRLKPVVLIGESLGAAVALQAAARDDRIRAVVAGASFSDLPTIVREKSPLLFSSEVRSNAVALAEKEGGFRVEDISPVRDAANIHVPALILVGLGDTYIAPTHSMRIYAALAGPKRLIRFDGVGHVDILTHSEAWTAIHNFVSEFEKTF